MREYKIAAIPGDGIGPEVIAAGLEVLAALAVRDGGFTLQVEHFPWSSDYYLQHGRYIPDGGLDRLRVFDAIFFGAVGSRSVPDHVSLWELRLAITQGFDHVVMVHGDGLVALQYRSAKGEATLDVKSTVKVPATVRLERHGETFSAYAAPAGGKEFVLIGSIKVAIFSSAGRLPT